MLTNTGKAGMDQDLYCFRIVQAFKQNVCWIGIIGVIKMIKLELRLNARYLMRAFCRVFMVMQPTLFSISIRQTLYRWNRVQLSYAYEYCRDRFYYSWFSWNWCYHFKSKNNQQLRLTLLVKPVLHSYLDHETILATNHEVFVGICQKWLRGSNDGFCWYKTTVLVGLSPS